ncbi:DoxX family protein [Bailinhaonella thermotolerans]|uniref:DoxX family membrane protein n=1 Tax=Bailinhaonella thermotolerans TaxID=1070861 RepID=A0A3A4ANL0_9ACTN|nr:hypothetical protein [Bailinhaonella thermotolerans]RJL27200.1 hypothetical protein D5H75_25750 [Bailinhaonella thermotolerans]
MFPFIIIPVGILIFRLLGAAGVRRFATLPAGAAHAMAVMLVITASAHFVPAGVAAMPNHGDVVAMMPPFIPFPGLVVYLTGVLELLGALGLVITRTRRPAGIALAIFFVLVLPANVHATLAGIPFAGQEPPPLWLRVPEQLVYIAVALWAARPAGVRAGGKTGAPAVEAPGH